MAGLSASGLKTQIKSHKVDKINKKHKKGSE